MLIQQDLKWINTSRHLNLRSLSWCPLILSSPEHLESSLTRYTDQFLLDLFHLRLHLTIGSTLTIPARRWPHPLTSWFGTLDSMIDETTFRLSSSSRLFDIMSLLLQDLELEIIQFLPMRLGSTPHFVRTAWWRTVLRLTFILINLDIFILWWQFSDLSHGSPCGWSWRSSRNWSHVGRCGSSARLRHWSAGSYCTDNRRSLAHYSVWGTRSAEFGLDTSYRSGRYSRWFTSCKLLHKGLFSKRLCLRCLRSQLLLAPHQLSSALTSKGLSILIKHSFKGHLRIWFLLMMYLIIFLRGLPPRRAVDFQYTRQRSALLNLSYLSGFAMQDVIVILMIQILKWVVIIKYVVSTGCSLQILLYVFLLELI